MIYDIANFDERCARCRSTRGCLPSESISRRIGGIDMTFDVSRAIRLCTEKTAIELPAQVRDLFLSVGDFDEHHVLHVNQEYPGIVVAYDEGLFLIDGHHRAEKCRRLKIPFKAYLFSDDEAKELAVPTMCLG